MRVDQLTLTGFRSYAALDLGLTDGPQVIVGDNAAGKTNLIEALVVLARGSSHRSTGDAELIRWGDPFARAEAGIGHGPARGPDRIEVTLERTGPGSARKRLRVNGVPRRAAALAEALRIVLFAPEDMLLVVGPPSLRRAAIDALAAARSPAYARAMATYGRALQQRNGLLRRIREGEAGPDELPYWDEIVVAEGGTIVAERLVLWVTWRRSWPRRTPRSRRASRPCGCATSRMRRRSPANAPRTPSAGASGRPPRRSSGTAPRWSARIATTSLSSSAGAT